MSTAPPTAGETSWWSAPGKKGRGGPQGEGEDHGGREEGRGGSRLWTGYGRAGEATAPVKLDVSKNVLGGGGGGRGGCSNQHQARLRAGEKIPALYLGSYASSRFWIVAFRVFFSRVSQEEVKKWAESLENLISHECKSDHPSGLGSPALDTCISHSTRQA